MKDLGALILAAGGFIGFFIFLTVEPLTSLICLLVCFACAKSIEG